MSDELEKLKAENARLKKELAEIQEARTFRVSIPDSWIDDE